jgi:hypothetical protein
VRIIRAEARHTVRCDLLAEGNYGSLKQRLRTLGAAQVLNNQWALRSTHLATELKALLREFVSNDDRIFVAEVGAEWPSRRALLDLGKL